MKKWKILLFGFKNLNKNPQHLTAAAAKKRFQMLNSVSRRNLKFPLAQQKLYQSASLCETRSLLVTFRLVVKQFIRLDRQKPHRIVCRAQIKKGSAAETQINEICSRGPRDKNFVCTQCVWNAISQRAKTVNNNSFDVFILQQPLCAPQRRQRRWWRRSLVGIFT